MQQAMSQLVADIFDGKVIETDDFPFVLLIDASSCVSNL